MPPNGTLLYMNHSGPMIGLTLALWLCTPSSPPRPSDPNASRLPANVPTPQASESTTLLSSRIPWRVGLWKVGPIRYGMSVAEASAAVGESLLVLANSDSPPCASCILPKSAPPGLYLTVMGGQIARVDVVAPGIPTTDGVEVGSTIEQLKRLYSDTMETAASLGGELEFWLWSKDVERRRLIIFVTDGHRIVSYRAGYSGAAQVEE
jgi:hypothetical protein